MRRAFDVLFLSFVVVACSEDYREDSTPATSSDGGTEASTDAGSGADVATSALVSRPGIVECGPDISCTLGESYCCISDDGTGRPSYACAKTDADCSANRMRCDEAADCSGGAKCCATLALGSFAAICDVQCKAGQACRTDAECGDKKCIKQNCFGLVSFACGKQPFCEAL